MSGYGWIGVDLDGTLAVYDGWQGEEHVGAPVPAMVERVKGWLADGRDVRILTARASKIPPAPDDPRDDYNRVSALTAIELWCLEHVGQVLPITCQKDYLMVELWDDRAVQVIPNTGQRADGLA